MIAKRKNYDEYYIDTSVDGLLELVRRKNSIRFDRAAKQMKVDEKTLDVWCDALMEAGLIEMNYTFRGLVLSVGKTAADNPVEKGTKQVTAKKTPVKKSVKKATTKTVNKKPVKAAKTTTKKTSPKNVRKPSRKSSSKKSKTRRHLKNNKKVAKRRRHNKTKGGIIHKTFKILRKLVKKGKR